MRHHLPTGAAATGETPVVPVRRGRVAIRSLKHKICGILWAMENKRRIPYGVINWAKLVRECLFVDNTAYVRTLENVRTPVFLRPKCLGKYIEVISIPGRAASTMPLFAAVSSKPPCQIPHRKDGFEIAS